MNGTTDWELVAALVIAEVTHDVISGREGLALLAGHPPAREGTVLGRGEQAERFPAVPPSAARLILRVQDDEVEPSPTEKVPGGHPCLAAADNDYVRCLGQASTS